MALNLKNPEVERLAAELATRNKCTKTEAVRRALLENRDRTKFSQAGDDRIVRARRFLEKKVWPKLPPGASQPWTREQEDKIMGWGECGESV